MFRIDFIAASVVLGLALEARGEYRAYELAIVNETSGAARTLVSTLDDLQYAGYHPLGPGERVEIRATWMCWKRSDYFQAVCPNPDGGATPAAGSGPTANSAPPAPFAPERP